MIQGLAFRVVRVAVLLGLCATATLAQQYVISTYAGSGTEGYTGDGGPATSARINLGTGPGLAVDSAGNLYIAGYDFDASFKLINDCVRKVSTAGIITTVAGTGVSGFSGDGVRPRGHNSIPRLDWRSMVEATFTSRVTTASGRSPRMGPSPQSLAPAWPATRATAGRRPARS
jgi:hypothetical protein